MSNRNDVGLKEIKEITSSLKKLTKTQKNTVLAVVRGAVLIAEAEKEGAEGDDSGD
jgi:hypothetical protein